MARLILFLLLFVALYYVFTYLLPKLLFSNNRTIQESKPEELVQDPSCQTYIPKRSAVKKKVKGRVLYFCNQDCLKKYLQQGK